MNRANSNVSCGSDSAIIRRAVIARSAPASGHPRQSLILGRMLRSFDKPVG